MFVKIIYLISNNFQSNKIENSKILENIILEEHEIYQQFTEPIINHIINKNFKSNISLKAELISYKNLINNIKYETIDISLEEILSKREITEIDKLKLLNEELYNILNDYNIKNIIIVIDYKLIKFIKSLINKEKIYKKIYFNSDFNKPITYLLKEFYSLMC